MKSDLQGIFDALLEGVVILDEDGRVELTNGEALRLLDGPGAPEIGKPLREILGADHPLCQIVDRVRRSGRPAIHDEVEIPRRLAPSHSHRCQSPPLPPSAPAGTCPRVPSYICTSSSPPQPCTRNLKPLSPRQRRTSFAVLEPGKHAEWASAWMCTRVHVSARNGVCRGLIIVVEVHFNFVSTPTHLHGACVRRR